jgi:iron only hydrogenase large subunit-like protein
MKNIRKQRTLSEGVVNQSSELTENNNNKTSEVKMTRQQRRKMQRDNKKTIGMDDIIVMKGVHNCLNGMTFEYKVTKQDINRREFTGDTQLLQDLNSGLISPTEIARLLNDLYGEYPIPNY